MSGVVGFKGEDVAEGVGDGLGVVPFDPGS